MDLKMDAAAICLSHMAATSSTLAEHAVAKKDAGVVGYTYDKPVNTTRSW